MAVELLPLFAEQAKANVGGRPRVGDKPGLRAGQVSNERAPKSSANAAKAVGTSGRSDVRLALLVACSVEKAKPGSKIVSNNTIKVSATEFAEMADTTAHRILRHLEAWDKCCAKPTALAIASL